MCEFLQKMILMKINSNKSAYFVSYDFNKMATILDYNIDRQHLKSFM